ncbi:MAG: D-alanyl-D-alanine carboxypeptidase, partial [Clostridia bacterium]|nr:D-alanyl-D-alanine carboxypeptidase [Clostridia bacterium]
IIAENIAPDKTIEGFASMMNKKAAELGLKNTHFTNPCGTEDPDHYSTARDLANLGRAAMKLEAFRDVVGRTDFQLPDTNLRKSNEWTAGHLTYTNLLLKSRSKYYSKVTGIKTGYTELAGRCLVSSAINPDGLELVAVVLGADSYDTLFKESQKLLEYGFKNYSRQELVQKGKYVDRFEVADAVDAKKVELITNDTIKSILPVDETELKKDLTVRKTLNQPFKAPIVQGQVMGRIEYLYKEKVIGSVDLVAKDPIEKTTIAILRDKYKEIVSDKRFIFGVKAAVGLIVFIIILAYILRAINKRNGRNGRNGRKRGYNYSPSRKNHYRFKDYR